MKQMAEHNPQNFSDASQVRISMEMHAHIFCSTRLWPGQLCSGNTWTCSHPSSCCWWRSCCFSKSILGSKGNWSKNISLSSATTREGKTGLKLTLSEMVELLFLCFDINASWWLSGDILRQYPTLRGSQTGPWRSVSLKTPYKCPAASAWSHAAFRVVLI